MGNTYHLDTLIDYVLASGHSDQGHSNLEVQTWPLAVMVIYSVALMPETSAHSALRYQRSESGVV